MRKREFIEAGPCLVCQKPVMTDNKLFFFKLDLRRYVVDLGAVRRQAGLELAHGVAIGTILGPDEDLAREFGDPAIGVICGDCLTTTIGEIFETIDHRSAHGKNTEKNKKVLRN